MKAILRENAGDLALLIGNGINLYNNPDQRNSWKGLLGTLAINHIGPDFEKLPEGLSFTEFFDILEIHAGVGNITSSLQSEFCALMAQWRPQAQHRCISAWALAHQVPILTTNFEGTLGQPLNCKIYRLSRTRFVDYYPWDIYYAASPLTDPLKSFAIWHINGMQKYRRSVRLSLSHYMGSVERARSWLRRSGSRLFGNNDVASWRGATTWMHVFFHKPLLVFGLRLGSDEVFLRWLLIERARYFAKHPERRKKGWYVCPAHDKDWSEGKDMFLRSVGLEPVKVEEWGHMFDDEVWI